MKRVKASGFLLVLMLAGLGASASVFAQSASDSPLAFVNVDKNHDGLVSRSEVPKELHDLRSHFDQYDSDANHRLSEGEYAGYLVAASSGACQKTMQGAGNPNCGGASAVGGDMIERQGAALRASQPVQPPRTNQGH